MKETRFWALILEDPARERQLSPWATPLKPVLAAPVMCSGEASGAGEEPRSQWRPSTTRCTNKQDEGRKQDGPASQVSGLQGGVGGQASGCLSAPLRAGCEQSPAGLGEVTASRLLPCVTPRTTPRAEPLACILSDVSLRLCGTQLVFKKTQRILRQRHLTKLLKFLERMFAINPRISQGWAKF